MKVSNINCSGISGTSGTGDNWTETGEEADLFFLLRGMLIFNLENENQGGMLQVLDQF